MSDQRPPWEDVEPVVELRKPEPLPSTPPVKRPGELIPDLPQPWNEARIMRLGALVVATLFVVAFVIAASRACPWYLAWMPFLVGALPYLGFFTMAYQAHLKDESSSRTRRENFAQSKFDAGSTPIADQSPNQERYR